MWLRISAGACTGWFERAVCPGSWKVRSGEADQQTNRFLGGGNVVVAVNGDGHDREGPLQLFQSVISGRGLDECKNWRRAQYLMGCISFRTPDAPHLQWREVLDKFPTRFSRPCVLRIQHVPRTLVARRRPSRFLVGLTPLLQGMQVVGSLPRLCESDSADRRFNHSSGKCGCVDRLGP